MENEKIRQLQMYPSKPIIYYVKWSHEYKDYYLEPYQDKFPVPKKIYGDIEEIAFRVWNDFVVSDKSTGILLSGAAGGGKSLAISVISNLALKNKLAVIIIQKIKVDNNLIHWLSTLTNVVLYLDEFGKLINRADQDQMLTLFSDVNGSKKIYLLTENDTDRVSQYILNRPGRVRYHVDFNRVDPKTLEEYCADMKVHPDFYKDLLVKYQSAYIFTFDHLQCIVTEHLKYPNEELDKLLSWLNLDMFKYEKKYRVAKLVYLPKPEIELAFSKNNNTDITLRNLSTRKGNENCSIKFEGVKGKDGKIDDNKLKYGVPDLWSIWFSFAHETEYKDDATILITVNDFQLTLEPIEVDNGFKYKVGGF